MNKVLISAPYMLREKEKVQKMIDELNPDWDITWAPVEERLEEDELLEMLPSFNGIICGDDRITSKVIDKCDSLKAIVKWGTGIDSINKDYANSKGIEVRRTPGAFTEPVSDTTLAYMLSFARNVIVNDKVLKSDQWEKPQGFTIAEKVIGLIGFGDIGRRVSEKLRPFNCKVVVYDVKDFDANYFKELGAQKASLDEVLNTSDIISLHCDLNESSEFIINQSTIEKMKDGVIIINTARGPLIKEEDLVSALENGKVSGVALDVFVDEPLPLTSKLRRMDNAILAAHNSNSSNFFWEKVHLNSLKMMIEEFSK